MVWWFGALTAARADWAATDTPNKANATHAPSNQPPIRKTGNWPTRSMRKAMSRIDSISLARWISAMNSELSNRKPVMVVARPNNVVTAHINGRLKRDMRNTTTPRLLRSVPRVTFNAIMPPRMANTASKTRTGWMERIITIPKAIGSFWKISNIKRTPYPKITRTGSQNKATVSDNQIERIKKDPNHMRQTCRIFSDLKTL